MILFARPQRHARRRAHRIIGVPPVSYIPAKGDDRKACRRILIAEAVRRFSTVISRTQAGTPMILFARPQRHPHPRAHRIIGVSPVFPIPAKRRPSKA
jgi:hypothetical protein